MNASITNKSGSLETVVAGVRLVPFFQRYFLVAQPETIQGELLSRPEAEVPAEEFFSALSVEDQFRVLEWQIWLQQRMHKELGALTSINVHNRVVETNQDRERFLGLVEKASAQTTFEFTETYPMPPVSTSNHLLNAIRSLGNLSALDDFGTGLNGMSLLTDYDFDIIKIDRSLIFDIVDRPEKRNTLRLMLEMLRVLGKRHVVEGIENEEVLEILKQFGFEAFQGFLFGKPQRLADLLSQSGQGEKT